MPPPWEALKQKNQTVKSFSALELGKGEGPDRHVVVGCLVFFHVFGCFFERLGSSKGSKNPLQDVVDRRQSRFGGMGIPNGQKMDFT